MILLKWSEVSNLVINQSSKRLMNFDSDFKTGWVYSAIIQFFSDRSIKPQRIKEIVLTREDHETNMKHIRNCLLNVGVHPVLKPEDLVEQSPVQQVLFLTNLF